LYSAITASDRGAISPPLVISAAEIAEMFARFGRALDEVAAEIRPASKAA